MTAVLSVLGGVGLGVLYVLAFLLVLLLLLLFVPVSVKLRYENSEFSAVLQLLGIKFVLYPDAEQQWWYPKKTSKNKKEKTEKKPKTKEQASKAAKTTLGQVLALVRAGGMSVKLICTSLRITDIHIRLPITGNDAASVAQKYGKTRAWLHGSLAVLNNFLYLDFKEMRLDPIFAENLKTEEFFSCKISAQLYIMLVVAYRLFDMLRDDEDLRTFFSKTVKKTPQM